MADIFDLTDTWNSGATTFTAIKMNVTDTSSAAASLLMDLQVGGSSKMNVAKDGTLYLPVAVGNGGAVIVGGSGITAAKGYFGQYGARLASTLAFAWAAAGNLNTLDLTLYRDAANTLAQRNGTNAQLYRTYNTYTDASNYERVVMGWNTNVFEIKPEAAGTGSTRVIHISGLPTSNPGAGILWNNAGTPAIGT